MKSKKILSIFLSAALTFVCMPLYADAYEIPEGAEYIEGEILLSSSKEIEDAGECILTASVSDEVLLLDFETTGIEEIEKLNESEPEEDTDNVYVAKIDGDVEKLCKKLNKNNDIIAEPNYIYRTQSFTMPQDIYQTGGIYETYQKFYFEDILHIPEAWQEHEVTGEGVTIAVIDNGFFYTGVDAPKNLWSDSNGNIGYNAYDPSSTDIGPVFGTDGALLQDTAHGSNVAGIIGMRANGTNGIGVAFDAELMLIKAGFYNGGTRSLIGTDALYRGIQFAKNNGADIINLSIGTSSLSSNISSLLQSAYNDGIAIIAAAGNEASASPCYPAAYSFVMGVMALSTSDPTQLTAFSNYETGQNYYNIAAPGEAIIGCGYKGTGLSLLSGTSQASPIVAGCAALYMQLHPECTVDELYEALINSCTERVTSNSQNTSAVYTYPSLNCENLLDYVITPPIPDPVIVLNEAETFAVYDNGRLYGLDEGFTDINHYISVAEGTGTMTYTPNENGNGTGSLISIYDINGDLRSTLTVVIFGDIDGDGYVNGEDAVLLSCYVSRLLQLSDAQIYAADVNRDNAVTVNDQTIGSVTINSDYSTIALYAVGLDSIYQN